MGGREVGGGGWIERGLAGDELTGYYWLCGGLDHKSLLSPHGRHGQSAGK